MTPPTEPARLSRDRPVRHAADGDLAVRIQNLDVTFATDGGDVAAVRGVSLDVRAGEVLAIVGESGSGKTVTARTILGLLPETARVDGVVLLGSGADAADIVTIDEARLRELRGSEVAMIFQEPSSALNPVYTVGWQLAEGLRAHGKYTKRAARARAIEMLARVGIPNASRRVDDYPHQFSGGQKQRIVIAMALALAPSVIVADEPTTALDVTVQAEILDLLRQLRDETGTAIVLITHNMGVVADLSDRVAVMLNGQIVETAASRELFAAPQHEYTKRLLAAVPRLEIIDRPLIAASDVPAIVEATGLVIEYPGRFGRSGFRAVKGIDFSISPGEVLGLVGESGSGKTTIGRAIAGLTKVSEGSLRVLGTEMRGVRERSFRPLRRELGFVFQDPGTSFNPLLTIANCVAEPLVVHGVAENPAAARPRVDELLEAVQLPKAFGDRYPHELSGGQRQRASLARALALNPTLLIADEPTSALDVSVQARVLELFAELQGEFGFATLFITHDLAVVDQLAHRVVVLHQGEIAEEGPTAQVLGNPQDPYTRRLLASLPVPDPVEQARRRSERLAAVAAGADSSSTTAEST